MIFFILQIAFLIVTTRHVYMTAKSNGHSAVFWASINAAIFLAIPILFGILMGVGLGVAATAELISMSTAETLLMFSNLLGLGLAILAVILILKHVSRLNDSEGFEPPPAPRFFDLK